MDLDDYLRALTADGYPADRIVRATCTCGDDRFQLDADAVDGCARRTCVRCRSPHLICDSAEAWEDAEPKPVVCACGAAVFQIAVAFSHRSDATVKWITVGVRCVACGTLGAAVDWKVNYGPTDHLYAQV